MLRKALVPLIYIAVGASVSTIYWCLHFANNSDKKFVSEYKIAHLIVSDSNEEDKYEQISSIALQFQESRLIEVNWNTSSLQRRNALDFDNIKIDLKNKEGDLIAQYNLDGKYVNDLNDKQIIVIGNCRTIDHSDNDTSRYRKFEKYE